MAKRQIELPVSQATISTQVDGGAEEARNVDPLTEEQASSLLTLVDVIRDPLHGDIRLTGLERLLIDTPEFQRLRNVNQLAMTYMAYPGAIHTRFIHSLGVLHISAQMIETCNANAANYRRLAAPDHPIPLKITSYGVLLARLCALLHDLAHVPFGHTLEKEGKVFLTDEWQDKHRLEKLLGRKSALFGYISDHFKSLGFSESAAAGLLEDIRDILSAKSQDVSSLPYPFIHDLVGNTICADLIDYVQRDMYFCGLTESLGKRFLEYLAVVLVEESPGRDGARSRILRPCRLEGEGVIIRRKKKGDGEDALMCRLVLLQYRYNERRSFVKKHDIVAESIDLVRRRLTVAEKLYFHRTKIAASAMLIAAAFSARLSAGDLWNLSDSEVLKLLASSSDPRAKAIGGKLISRKLFKPIYRVSYYRPDDSVQSEKIWKAYDRFSQPEEREKLISRLERVIGAIWGGSEEGGIGSVAISCPDKDMNLKAFDMLVLPTPRSSSIGRLQDSDSGPTQLEIQAIQETHRHLWKLEVFVDPAIVPLDPVNPSVRELVGAIQFEIGLNNESATFGDIPSISLDSLEFSTLIDYELAVLGVGEAVTHAHYRELTQGGLGRFRGSSLSIGEQIREFLRSKGYTV